MKTIYLLGWLINATLLLIFWVKFNLNFGIIILPIFNFAIPLVLLFIRMIFLHSLVEKDDIPV